MDFLNFTFLYIFFLLLHYFFLFFSLPFFFVTLLIFRTNIWSYMYVASTLAYRHTELGHSYTTLQHCVVFQTKCNPLQKPLFSVDPHSYFSCKISYVCYCPVTFFAFIFRVAAHFFFFSLVFRSSSILLKMKKKNESRESDMHYTYASVLYENSVSISTLKRIANTHTLNFLHLYWTEI